jgi:LPXTG-motif cell wall-anchored protein
VGARERIIGCLLVVAGLTTSLAVAPVASGAPYTDVASSGASTSPGGVLAFTGASTTVQIWIGVAMVVAGLALVLAARRRRVVVAERSGS